MTTIKEAVLSTIEKHIDQQNSKGMKNYGQTLDDCPVEDYNWQNMIIEELIDALQYQQKHMKKLESALNGLGKAVEVYSGMPVNEALEKAIEIVEEESQ